MRGQGRLGADNAAAAFEALQQRGFLAADIGAGADADFEIEAVTGAADARAEIAGPLRRRYGCVHGLNSVRIFRADVDVALGGADRDARDRHALDHDKRVAFHDHAVGESAAVAFVGITDDVFPLGAGLRHGLPFDPGRKTGAATAAQSGSRDIGEDGVRIQRQGALQALTGVKLDHRAERDTALRCCDLDHRLQPIQPARAGSDDLDFSAALASSQPQHQCDFVAPDRNGASIS